MNTLQNGFTVVELLIVAALLALLAFVMGPQWSHLQTYSERAYFAEIVSAAQYAQKRAIASNCPVELNIDSDNFQLLQPADCQPSSAHDQPLVDPASPQDPYLRNAPDSITNTATILRFSSVGQALNASNQVQDFTINVGDRTMHIDGLTGWTRQNN